LAATSSFTAQTALVVLAASNWVSSVLTLWYVRPNLRMSIPLDRRLLVRTISYGAKLAAANILALFSLGITVILLGYFRDKHFVNIGLYTRAVAVANLVILVPVAFGPLLYAKWSSVTGEARARQAEMATRLNLGYGLVGCLSIVFLGRHILRLLYGEEFVPAAIALPILGPALVLHCVFGVTSNLLAAAGKAMVTAFILVGTVIVVASVTFLAVPHLGIRGAALGALCGNAFTATAGLVVCCRLFGLKLRACLLPQRGDWAYIRQALRRPRPVPTEDKP